MGPKVVVGTKIVPEGDCEHNLYEHFFFHKSTNSPEVVQRVFDKVLLGVLNSGVISGVVHGLEVSVVNSPVSGEVAA